MSTSEDKDRLPRVTPELIEAAVNRARKERSEAFWALLQAVFGRPESRASDSLPAGPSASPCV
jgi:hypothetical protein